MENNEKALVLGIDYGTDSCRAVLTDPADGRIVAQAVSAYSRWKAGLYCDPERSMFRQHPQDYIDSLVEAMTLVRTAAGDEALSRVAGIAIDTTGSTPCAVNAQGTPLSLTPEFAENPDAMFVLWKDHTATAEAARINSVARTWGGVDFTQYEGGVYSSEWFWAKVMHIVDSSPQVAAAAATYVEHCDWMPALLCGATAPGELKRSRCAMGHKAMWHAEFGGYPSKDFLALLDPRLPDIALTLGKETFTSDAVAGKLCGVWAEKLGLPALIPVAVGAYDAHMGALGGGVAPGVLVKVMGTSTCDMIVAPRPEGGERLVRGICGQVDGSIVPGMLGYEAGQSAFGDVYAWFRRLLSWAGETVLPAIPGLDPEQRALALQGISDGIMDALEKEATAISPEESSPVALDWLNGRRTPDADQTLKGAITGLTLGTSAPAIYRALVEATAFGTRAIVERFRAEGVSIERIVGIGGVAKKSRLATQVVADVLGMPLDIVAGDQSVALGAAMFASVVAGIHKNLEAARAAMLQKIERTVEPDPARHAIYDRLYGRYVALGSFIEGEKA